MKLWSSCSHVYICVSRLIIISLHVSPAYLQQMFGNWFCIIHQASCYSFTLYLFCFLWIEHTQNECSEPFITCQWTQLMRDMKAFSLVLCFGALKLLTTYFCLNIYLYLKPSNWCTVRGTFYAEVKRCSCLNHKRVCNIKSLKLKSETTPSWRGVFPTKPILFLQEFNTLLFPAFSHALECTRKCSPCILQIQATTTLDYIKTIHGVHCNVLCISSKLQASASRIWILCWHELKALAAWKVK